MVRVAIHTAQFRQNDGPVTLQIPKGSQLLKVHQSGSGYWFADCLAPEKSDGLEPLELLLITDKAASVDLDLSVWSCVGHATSHQGRRCYVFHKASTPPAPANRKPGRPRKAAQTPPVDVKPQ